MRRRTVHGGQQPRARRRTLAVALTAVALGLTASAFSAPANALSGKWMLGYTDSTTSAPDFAQPGDVIGITNLDLSLTITYGGPLLTIDCNNVAVTGLDYTVPAAGAPSGQPGDQISIELDTPTTTLTGCSQSLDGQAVDLSFVQGSQWTLAIDLSPTSGSADGEAFTAPLTGSLTIRDGDPSGYGNGTVIVSMLTWAPFPCTFQGPAAVDLTVDGSYDPSTGVASNTNRPPFFLDNGAWPPPPAPQLSGIPASSADCPNVGIQATLQSASVTVEGPNGKTPTVVWSP